MNQEDRELGVCCAEFYNHPLVVKLLDGIFHPGGLALSRLMVDKMGLDKDSTLLDIACGDGKTATYLAKSLGLHVSGIDVSEEMITVAIQRAEDIGVQNRTDFRVALASKVPYESQNFNAVISECALCTFYDKEAAMSELSRVLKPGGIVGLNDVIVKDHGALGEELRGLLSRIACVAGALSTEQYIHLFEKWGLVLQSSSNHSSLLLDMANKAKGRAIFFKAVKDNKENISKMTDAIRMIGQIEKQILSGNVGYEMFVFQSK
jgi:cyclopropane fatty-acyl-phospholipid synthase-like methyltransferase